MGNLAGTCIQSLLLKDLSQDQTERFYEHIQENRARYTDTIPFVSRTHSIEEMRENITRNLVRQAEGISDLYTLWQGERMAGYFLVREKDISAKWSEIGYMIGGAWQGKGITKTICCLLIEDLFTRQGMEKIVICCNDDNLASIAVARSLGFQLEGTLRNHYVVNGKLRNMLYFGLLKQEWTGSSE